MRSLSGLNAFGAQVLTHQSRCDASLMGSLDGEERLFFAPLSGEKQEKEPISAEIARISGEKAIKS